MTSYRAASPEELSRRFHLIGNGEFIQSYSTLDSAIRMMKMLQRGRRLDQVRFIIRDTELDKPDTSVSGYSAHGPMIDPPDYDYYCHTCNNDPCTCNQPPHEADYLSAWRDGAFDDDLVGCAESEFVVGFERVVAL